MHANIENPNLPTNCAASHRLAPALTRRFAALAAALLLGAGAASGDAVLDWNAIMQETVADSDPFLQTRSAAIVQLAVFEAVNSIVGDYDSYGTPLTVAKPASPEAAVVAAAHRTLASLHPAAASRLDELKSSSLAAIPDGEGKRNGIAAGERAAESILALRANDRASHLSSYEPGKGIGRWRPTPPAFAPAYAYDWGFLEPFGIHAASDFRCPPPPRLDSDRYARDLDEVKRLGAAASALRPADRADVARFYAVVLGVELYHPAARQVSAAQGRTLAENARIFALLAMAHCDGLIASMETKYHYGFWRPVTAIHSAALDDNERTAGEAGWTSFIDAPAFPSYPSAHASGAGAALAALERLFGTRDIEITLSDPRLPEVTLHYRDWATIGRDIDDARIYGGIHFRFDQEAGAGQGRRVAEYVLRHKLQPVRKDT